jgi:hypothetical protein
MFQDVPAVLSFVLEKTGAKQVHWIGELLPPQPRRVGLQEPACWSGPGRLQGRHKGRGGTAPRRRATRGPAKPRARARPATRMHPPPPPPAPRPLDGRHAWLRPAVAWGGLQVQRGAAVARHVRPSHLCPRARSRARARPRPCTRPPRPPAPKPCRPCGRSRSAAAPPRLRFNPSHLTPPHPTPNPPGTAAAASAMARGTRCSSASCCPSPSWASLPTSPARWGGALQDLGGVGLGGLRRGGCPCGAAGAPEARPRPQAGRRRLTPSPPLILPPAPAHKHAGHVAACRQARVPVCV